MAKTNSKSKRSQIADLALQIADHQARIQTLAANWGEEINAQLNATEKAFMTKLAKELKNFKFNSNAKETLDRLKKITARLNAIRKAAYERAEEKVREEARKLAENEMKWGKRITQELSEPGTRLKDPSPTLLDKVVKFGLADGKTLQEYFSGIADADAVRIESSIRQGVESGWTIDQIARNIAGSAENHYKDGVFETSRKSAVNMARTLCNAVSNNAKDAFYNANSDVISGVEILSTLDGRTCPVCASLDRQRYPLGKPHPALPVHHSCRCVLLPVTPLSDLIEEERPMANSDFMKDAKEAYKKRFPKKDWDSLSDSTKKKYYYEAMRLYEKRTGKPAYTQVSGSVSFRDYFEKHMTDDQRLKWLGPERFKIWKHGNLPLDKFIPPYPDKRMTVDALKAEDKKSFEKKPEKHKAKPQSSIEELHKQHLEKRKQQWMDAYDKRRDAWVKEMKNSGVSDEIAGQLADIYTPEMAKLGKPPKIVLNDEEVQHYNRRTNTLQLKKNMARNDIETLRHEMTHWWHYGVIKKHPEIQIELKKAAANDLARIKKLYSSKVADFQYSNENARNKAAQEIFHVDSFDSLTFEEQRTVRNFFNSVGSISSGKIGGMHGNTWATVDDRKENKTYFEGQNNTPWRCNYGEVVAELCERFDDENDKLRLAFSETWSIVKKYKGI